MSRWAWAEIDHDAIRHNVDVLRRAVAPSAVWAVVKADGYGHGAIDVARSALGAGAEGLCVALVDEGVELRRAGIDAPVLLLSEQPLDDVARIVEHRLFPTVYTRPYIEALAAVDGLDGSTDSTCISRSTPAWAASESLLRTRSRSPRSSCTTAHGCGWPARRPIWRAPTPSLTRRRPISSRCSRPCSRRLPANRSVGPRRELGRCLGPSAGAVLVRPGGDRDVRDLARSRRRRSLPASCARR